MINRERNIYNRNFFKEHQRDSRESAEEIVPLILELVSPRSVVDVGCGVGTWLAVFKKYGVDDFLGIDGGWVDKGLMQIPREKFKSVNLEGKLNIDREFELAISLEVAEHLSANSAQDFVKMLAKLAPIILFSAAIPNQGGTRHLNERWPSYWARLFEMEEYVTIDALRKQIWDNENIAWWYRQNILFFVHKDKLNDYPNLKREQNKTNLKQLNLAHPQILEIKSNTNPSKRNILKGFKKKAKNVLGLKSIEGMTEEEAEKRTSKPKQKSEAPI